MKTVFFVVLMCFCMNVFADANPTFQQHARLNNLLAESPSISEKVDEMKERGFKYYGFLNTGVTAFCDCQVVELTFVKYENPKDSSELMRTKVVQNLLVYIEDLHSDVPTVKFK